jgi:hypothetical protein
MTDTTLPTRVTPLPGGGLAIWSKRQTANDPKRCDECQCLIKDGTPYIRVQMATLRPGESPRSRDDLRAIAFNRRATLSLHPNCTPKEYQP